MRLIALLFALLSINCWAVGNSQIIHASPPLTLVNGFMGVQDNPTFVGIVTADGFSSTTGVIAWADGSAANPSLALASGPTNGFWGLGASNILGGSTNGVQAFQISAGGLWTIGNGAPSGLHALNVGGTPAAGVTRGVNVSATLNPSGGSFSAFRSNPTLAAGATATSYTGYNGSSLTVGAGATVNRVIDFFTNNQVAGALGNATLSDDAALFTGNWFIYQLSAARPNKFSSVSTFANTTDATSSTSGSIVTSGGLGVLLNLNVGGTATIGTAGANTTHLINGNFTANDVTTSPVVWGFYKDVNAGDSTANNTITIGNSGAAQGATRILYGNDVAAGAPEFKIAFEPRNNAGTSNYSAAYISMDKIAASGGATMLFTTADAGGTIRSALKFDQTQSALFYGSHLYYNTLGATATISTLYAGNSLANDGGLEIDGGNSTGGRITLYGATHSTKASQLELGNSIALGATYGTTSGAGQWNFGTGGLVSTSGAAFTQNFTSNSAVARGIDLDETFSTTATVSLLRLHTTVAPSVAMTEVRHISPGGVTLGSGASVGRITDYFTNNQNLGSTGNAAFADNSSYTGNWFINQAATTLPIKFSSVLQLSDGSAATPELVAAAGTTTGIWFTGTSGIMGFSSAGVEVARVSGTQLNVTGGSDLSTTGAVRIGFTSTASTPPNAGTGLRVLANQNYNGTADSLANGIYVTSQRAITTTQSENLGMLTARMISQIVVPTAQTYTNTNVFETLRLENFTLSGGGTMAVTSAVKLNVYPDSTATGTYKAGIIIGAQTGATNNSGLTDSATASGATLWINQTANVANSFAGISTFANTTDASSTSTGSLITAGGLGVAKKLYVGTGLNLASLTASQAVFTDGSKNLVSNAITGTGNVVMSASPTIGSPSFTTQATFGNYHLEPQEHDFGNSSTAQTIDWSQSSTAKSTLTGNVTYTFSNPVTGGTYALKVNTGAGSFTTTWPAAVHWTGGTAPTTTATASKVDVYTFYYDGSTYFGTYSQNYAP